MPLGHISNMIILNRRKCLCDLKAEKDFLDKTSKVQIVRKTVTNLIDEN